ncbi:CRISPR-associated protein Cas7/Cst2/DevR, subtype I-B/TNEAP [Cesiribacter andamanensis]|uniref:CRISPR-associated protein Cas7/Cst2/DevR, subtype I-B/TNEAP n=1 Tax=Cesiribacter andamanensis AMV16 TaxID=1279009 RepID=M7P0L6_9BACT|nr:CRISPR-associated protein Cas7/Cst2/DevR, subtype I-B/TNEAP [Cesiribacter andamanensis]EMR04139.1 CRISPR-associated protein Cas7/Cst2/DevR, subtype I-B/TNEAP [Cesiribacter andamanensis AMV16]
MNPYLYIRTLKHADHTVFCVEDGQKRYYDPIFNKQVPYSSGQQVKRSMLTTLTDRLNEQPAPVTFFFDLNAKNQLGEGEAYTECDPTYADQLFGGWMRAESGGKKRTIKRRSPLSISAMRLLHPLLGGIEKENITFDRSERPGIHNVIVRDAKGNAIPEAQVEELLEGSDRSLRRKWIPNNTRASGLFVQDIAIDMRTLFSVSLDGYEPELSPETIEKLRSNGWVESANVFGKCLICPAERRKELISALAYALVNWRITSNQARTYSPMETLALAIGQNANTITYAIQAKLDEIEAGKALPSLNNAIQDVNLFVSPAAEGFVTEKGMPDALYQAELFIVETLASFNYENQLSKK